MYGAPCGLRRHPTPRLRDNQPHRRFEPSAHKPRHWLGRGVSLNYPFRCAATNRLDTRQSFQGRLGSCFRPERECHRARFGQPRSRAGIFWGRATLCGSPAPPHWCFCRPTPYPWLEQDSNRRGRYTTGEHCVSTFKAADRCGAGRCQAGRRARRPCGPGCAWFALQAATCSAGLTRRACPDHTRPYVMWPGTHPYEHLMVR